MSEQLNEWRNKYQALDVTELELDQAMEIGLDKAKQKKKRVHYRVGTLVVAAIFFLSVITLVNISPVFAQQLENIPGMEKLISLVQFNKGQKAAIENEYYQILNRAEKKDELALTIDGVIRDEKGLVIFYTIESEKAWEQLRIKEFEILSEEGQELSDYTMSYYSPGEGNFDEYSGVVEIFSEQRIPFDQFKVTTKIVAENSSGREEVEETFEIAFEALATKESKYYSIDETVEVDDQKIHVESVTIHPLRVEVKLQADPSNTMHIFSIDDLAIVNESGEIWSGISGGITASGSMEENNYKVYLQSNYFENPDNLTLAFSKIQAVEKEKNYLRLDLENEQILHDPYGVFIDMKYENNKLALTMPVADINFPLGQIYDQNGNEIENQLDSAMKQVGDLQIFEKVIYTEETIIDVRLNGYPNWITKEVKISIK